MIFCYVSSQQWLWLSSQKSCPACDNFAHLACVHPDINSFQIHTSKYPRSPHQSIPIKFLFYHEENVYIVKSDLQQLINFSWCYNHHHECATALFVLNPHFISNIGFNCNGWKSSTKSMFGKIYVTQFSHKATFWKLIN